MAPATESNPYSLQVDGASGRVTTSDGAAAAVIPYAIWDAVPASPQLADAVRAWGRRAGQRHTALRDATMQDLAQAVADQAAELGLGTVTVRLVGDALILECAPPVDRPLSPGVRHLLEHFWSGYFDGVSGNGFAAVADAHGAVLIAHPDSCQAVRAKVQAGDTVSAAVHAVSQEVA